jgi:serine/threonine protein kinase
VDAVTILHTANVVHFDLKLQNLYVESIPTRSTDGSHSKSPAADDFPPPNIVIGDFGESKMFSSHAHGYTLQPLGTDFMKSPEMLRNGQHPVLNQRRENFDRRRHEGAGAPSDIWSLGCLLYELVFGDMLFFDEDYMRFLQRVCFSTGPVLPPEAVVKLQHTPIVHSLVTLLTERNHEARIDIFKLQSKLASISVEKEKEKDANANKMMNESIVPARAASSPLTMDQAVSRSQFLAPSVCSLHINSAHQQLGSPEFSSIVYFTNSILLCSAQIACTHYLQLALAGVQCLLISPDASYAKAEFLRCGSRLHCPCVFFTQEPECSRSILQVCEHVKQFQCVAVLFGDDDWSFVSTVATAVAMRKDGLARADAMLQLRRRWLYSRFSLEHVKLLEQVCRDSKSN